VEKATTNKLLLNEASQQCLIVFLLLANKKINVQETGSFTELKINILFNTFIVSFPFTLPQYFSYE